MPAIFRWSRWLLILLMGWSVQHVYADLAPGGQGGSTAIPQLAPGSGGAINNPATFSQSARSTATMRVSQGGTMPLLDPIDDGAEVYNRGAFTFNDWMIKGLIDPLQTAWKVIFPLPVRKHIRKFGYNLAWPNRLVNCMMQNKWRGAGSETVRFLCNTTLGVVGFFDPATKFGLKNYNEDWGQTFYEWGWNDSNYFVVPLMGPSSWRDGLGKIPDAAFNPATYLFGASTVFNFNEMTFYLPSYKKVMRSEKDPYALTRDVWAVTREQVLQDFEIDATAKHDPAPTLSAVFLEVRDKSFLKQAKTGSVHIDATGRKLKYNYWLQDHEAPLLFVLGGAGSFRLSDSTAAHAEMAYDRGFSVVTISSVFNWEFIQNAASESVTGYTPVDAQDVYSVLNEIYKQMRRRQAITSASLLGVSLGALDTLFIARDDANRSPDDLKFARYVAINPPVDLLYALKQIDTYYKAPLAWPAAEREQRVQDTLLKVSALAEQISAGKELDSKKPLPFDRIESDFLIALTFRMTLRDVIYTSQERENIGVLQHDIAHARRQPLYHEIAQYDFDDYMNKFVLPYYFNGSGKPRVRNLTPQDFLKGVNLWSIEKEISGNPKVFIFTNQNDFLLRPQDLEWLEQKFTTRFTSFPEGGHLGNLYLPEVQEMVMQPLIDLKGKQAQTYSK